MHSTDELNQCNWILGEAVMELLGENTPITTDSLLDKMHAFQGREEDGYQKAAINCAINTITSAAATNKCLLRGITATSPKMKLVKITKIS